MSENPFDELAEQAASGLKADAELFLDVKQEIKSHLEEKAEYFASTGCSPEESVELAEKSFGSPMEVAGEILEANKEKMKLRSRLRLMLGAVVVPIAVILALYLTLGRALVAWGVDKSICSHECSSTRLFNPYPDRGAEFRKQVNFGNSDSMLTYWRNHQSDPDSRIWYARYVIALCARTRDVKACEEAVCQGERIEPENALYNMVLASCYLRRGVSSRHDKERDAKNKTDDILSRRDMELGIAELRRAARKPYYRTYSIDMARKALETMPPAILTEDYYNRMTIAANFYQIELTLIRSMTNRLLATVRLMIREGRQKQAEDLLGTCHQLGRLLAGEPDQGDVALLVRRGSLAVLAKEGAEAYSLIGENLKAQRSMERYKALESIMYRRSEMIPSDHAAVSTSMLGSVLRDKPRITDDDLRPGRMHEHVLMEEAAVAAQLVGMTLLMLGSILSGALWLHGRKGEPSPMLLFPTAKIVLKALLFGIALPMIVYWIYSRLPNIGGREYSVWSDHRLRFIREIFVLWLVMLYVPINVIRRHIRMRCEMLGIELPRSREESRMAWASRISLWVLLCSASGIYLYEVNTPLIALLVAGLIGCTASVMSSMKKVRQYPIYKGTVARSMVPLYAFAIIFVSLLVHPWLMYNEAKLLREDRVGIGYLGKSAVYEGGTCGMEPMVTRVYAEKMRRVME